jgi:hypothetical protein
MSCRSSATWPRTYESYSYAVNKHVLPEQRDLAVAVIERLLQGDA